MPKYSLNQNLPIQNHPTLNRRCQNRHCLNRRYQCRLYRRCRCFRQNWSKFQYRTHRRRNQS